MARYNYSKKPYDYGPPPDGSETEFEIDPMLDDVSYGAAGEKVFTPGIPITSDERNPYASGKVPHITKRYTQGKLKPGSTPDAPEYEDSDIAKETEAAYKRVESKYLQDNARFRPTPFRRGVLEKDKDKAKTPGKPGKGAGYRPTQDEYEFWQSMPEHLRPRMYDVGRGKTYRHDFQEGEGEDYVFDTLGDALLNGEITQEEFDKASELYEKANSGKPGIPEQIDKLHQDTSRQPMNEAERAVSRQRALAEQELANIADLKSAFHDDEAKRKREEAEISRRMDEHKMKLQAAFDDLDSIKYINPWGPGNNAAMGIAAVFGTLGAMLTRSPNYAMQMLNKRIDQTLQHNAQLMARGRAKANQKLSLLGHMRKHLGDEKVAMEASRKALLTDVYRQVKLNTAKAKTLAGRQAGEDMLIALEERIALSDRRVRLSAYLEARRAMFRGRGGKQSPMSPYGTPIMTGKEPGVYVPGLGGWIKNPKLATDAADRYAGYVPAMKALQRMRATLANGVPLPKTQAYQNLMQDATMVQFALKSTNRMGAWDVGAQEATGRMSYDPSKFINILNKNPNYAISQINRTGRIMHDQYSAAQQNLGVIPGVRTPYTVNERGRRVTKMGHYYVPLQGKAVEAQRQRAEAAAGYTGNNVEAPAPHNPYAQQKWKR